MSRASYKHSLRTLQPELWSLRSIALINWTLATPTPSGTTTVPSVHMLHAQTLAVFCHCILRCLFFDGVGFYDLVRGGQEGCVRDIPSECDPHSTKKMYAKRAVSVGRLLEVMASVSVGDGSSSAPRRG
jgi:hypothetical protein